MLEFIDLDRYPLHAPNTEDWQSLVETCKTELAKNGLFNLPGFLRAQARDTAVQELAPVLATQAFTHARQHNIYFKKSIDGLDQSHPALRQFETSNRTICADQMGDALVIQLYEWPPFAGFLAAVMDQPALYPMKDPLARVNVMSYGAGQTLNWHFDRSEFTTTLLLQAPAEGGVFLYDQDLRSDTDPNYRGVADLLEGRRQPVAMPLEPGTLNVFRGKNTAHRVTPVAGARARIIVVFSYFNRPDVVFTAEEQIGFYGRSA